MVKLPIDHWNGFNDPLHSWTAQGTNLHTAKRKWAITPDGIIKANEWTYIAVGIHTADGEPTLFTPFFFSETLVNANQDSYIKFIQLTKGNQPVTDWIPPLNEVVSSGEFAQVTNEIKQTATENTATITKLTSSINNENHLYDSSANHVLPKFINGMTLLLIIFSMQSTNLKEISLLSSALTGTTAFIKLGTMSEMTCVALM